MYIYIYIYIHTHISSQEAIEGTLQASRASPPSDGQNQKLRQGDF